MMRKFDHRGGRHRVALRLALVLMFVAASDVWAENLTVTINSGNYQIVDVGNGRQIIKMDGFSSFLVPGRPALPARSFMIALPPSAEVVSVTSAASGDEEISGTFSIAPIPPALPDNDDAAMVKRCQQEWQRNHDMVYLSDNAYPVQSGEYQGQGGLRKYAFARVAYYPFTYHPQSGRLVLHRSLTVSIEYTRQAAKSQDMNVMLADTKADGKAAELFVNFSEAQNWYRTAAPKKSADAVWDYVIITTDALSASVTSLVEWKELIGYKVQVVTTSYIESTYSGADLPQKIRNFLSAVYLSWGLEYVLIVGDIDVIPMRHCYPDPTNHNPNSDYSPPTDYYYADMTGNWDSDGDGYYGEYGQDAVDLVPELSVGRIPYSNAVSVSAICEKLVGFESNTDSWKNNCLLLGAISNYGNEDASGYERTDGADLMEEMIWDFLPGAWPRTTMYEGAGLDPSIYTCSAPLSHANVINSLTTNDYGLVNWWAHGSSSQSFRKWWAADANSDGVPQSDNPPYEMDWQAFIGTSDIGSLPNDRPPIIFSCSCDNGWPENNNLGKNILRNGSASIVVATRVSWYTIGWNLHHGGNASLDYWFFYYMVVNNRKVGDALFDSKVYYLNHYFWWEWKGQQNMFDFNLYGDPALIRQGTVIPGCCHGIRGNINGDIDDKINVSDVTYLLGYLFGIPIGPKPPCDDEANANGDAKGSINVSDVTYVMTYLFGIPAGGPPPACP